MFETVAKENRKEKENCPKTVKGLSIGSDSPSNIEDKILLEAPISTICNLLQQGQRATVLGGEGRLWLSTETPKIWTGLKDHKTKEESEQWIWCS